MSAALRLPRTAQAVIAADAKTAWPNEACGLLIGQRTAAGDIQVLEAVPSANCAPEAARAKAFEIDPALLLRLHRELRGTGHEIVGHYHSHPNGRAELSARDRAEAWTPGLVWLVVALRAGEVTSWAAFLHRSDNDFPLLDLPDGEG